MPEPGPVVITDIRVPFVRLMMFLIKLSLAAIPATIIVMIILFVIATVVGAIFGIQMGFWHRGGVTL